ncbi:MAG TPA: hypothetical protein VMY05_06290 [Acidobacteriota bacterium]|nr:hypothetical protein [Acidobacteriota bacterium]
MTSSQRHVIWLFTAAVAARLAFHHLTGFIADDAFITFRYARNLVAGLGFVYNAGEHVLGTSTPLFTLVLAMFATSGVAPVAAALVVSVISSGLTAMILYRWACSLRLMRLSVLPALLYVLWPRSVAADACGMETAFFTLLVTAGLYFQHRRLQYYAIGMATLATATRPEGGILLLLLLAYNVLTDRTGWLRYLLIPAVLLGPWCAFSWYYFGSPVPNSIPAKLALYSRFGAGSPWQTLVYVMAWHNAFGWLLTAAAVVGGWWLHRKQYFGRLEIVWMVSLILFFTLSPTRIFFWYIPPIYPVYLLFAAAALPWLLDRIASAGVDLSIRRQRAIGIAVTGALALLLAAGNIRPVARYREYQQGLESVHRQIGYYLYTHAEPDDLVAAEDIGYLGYYSKRRILDRDGLISPEVIPYNRQGAYGTAILDFAPDWLVAARSSPISGFLGDSVFLEQYRPETGFSALTWDYTVYSRRE